MKRCLICAVLGALLAGLPAGLFIYVQSVELADARTALAEARESERTVAAVARAARKTEAAYAAGRSFVLSDDTPSPDEAASIVREADMAWQSANYYLSRDRASSAVAKAALAHIEVGQGILRSSPDLPGRVDAARRAAADACLVILAEEVVVR